MGVDPRRRQRKLEKQNAKKKAAKKELARKSAGGLSGELRRVGRAPILHSCMGSSIWESGIGVVLLSRKLPDGRVAFANFLVDVYCLGVKDAFCGIYSRETYQRKVYEKENSNTAWIEISPEKARKLVEDAVEYAHELALQPHPDYRRARLIFGDIDAEGCDEQFEFGKDGKPTFINGPHDSPARCHQIMETLKTRCGEDGFETVLIA